MNYKRVGLMLGVALIVAQQTSPQAQGGRAIAIRGGTVLTVTRGTIQDGVVVIRYGKLAGVG